jgi:hypothetical protein
LLQETKARYLSLHEPDYTGSAQHTIVPCVGLPDKALRAQGVTYIDVVSRKYTKNLSEDERRFMSWLISYKGRYVPE